MKFRLLSVAGIMKTFGAQVKRFKVASYALILVLVFGATSAMAKGLDGKIGDVVFDSQWHLQVMSVQTPDSYAMKTEAEPYEYKDLSTFDVTKRIFAPKPGYKLVVFQCRVTNTQKSSRRLWVAVSDSANVRTVLTDLGGVSHTPIGYDFEGGPIQTKPLKSGETISFAVIFTVPQDPQLKELLFTLAANGQREQSKDAHITLADSAGAVK